MHVSEVMDPNVHTCSSNDTLDTAARLMWEGNCGFVVVADDGKAKAVLTDRDICMAAYTTGRALRDIVVSTAASRSLFAVHDKDNLDLVESLMRDKHIRRVPVLDAAGAVIGVVTLNRLVSSAGQLGRRHHALSAEALVRTMAAVGSHQDGHGTV